MRSAEVAALIAEADRARPMRPAGRTAASEAASPDSAAPGATPDAWTFADFSTLDTDPPPPRRWILRDWIPAASVTALFGSGGIGKSLVIQQIGTHVALGEPVFGIEVEQGAVLAMFCEDPPDELRRRGVRIQRLRGAPIGSAPFYAAGLAGEESTLVTFDREQRIQHTSVWARLVDAIERLRPILLVLDNIAHLFGGLENDRRHVTAFANALTGLAHRYELGVLLVGHVAKLEGSEYSGSTAWEAAVRTRLWLERKDDLSVVLHRRKANYATRDSITLDWNDGAFELAGQKDRRAAGEHAERVLLAGLATLTARQVATSHSAASAAAYLPRVLQREGLLEGVSLEAAARALGALLDAGTLEPNAPLPWKKPDRHPATGLRRTTLV